MIVVSVRRCTLAVVVAAAAVAAASCRGKPAGGVAAGSGGGSAAGGAGDKLAWPAIDEPALIALQMTERFELGAPVPLAITPDGAVLFRRSKPRDRVADLYQLDAAGKTTLLAGAAALAAGKPVAAASKPADAAGAAIDLGAGIEAISVSDDGARVLVPLAGRLFVIERATGASRELALGPARDAQLSPDGKRVAFVRGGDLWVAAIGEPATRIAQHPSDSSDRGAAPAIDPPERSYATPDPAARAFGRDRGYWWSPDSQSIAFERCDARAVETRFVADPSHPEQPPVASKLPRPGGPIAAVDLGIVSVRGGAPRWVSWDLVHFPYLARVVWPAQGPLTVIAVGREQTQVAVIAVDAATAVAKPLLVDKDPTWVNVVPDGLAWLPDGSGFLWLTENGAAWTLEHHAADGAHIHTVVAPDLGVRRIAGISPDGRDAIIESAADPREQHVWRVAIAGGEPMALTKGGGVHTARAAHGVVAISSQLRAGGRAAIALRGDAPPQTLPSVAERPAAVPTTKFEKVELDDHAQFAAITRPHAFDPRIRYPVVLRIGAEPEAKTVLDALDTYVLDQWYADGGFIVVRTDGRGTVNGDHAWQRAIAGDVLTLPMTDQIGAVKRLGAHYPELDTSRVSTLGGYLATLAVMLHPDRFAAGVAVSPITDWSLVDAASAERYMKTPATNPEGYRRTAAATYAEQLARPLLIMPSVPGSRIALAHGVGLIEALAAAGKRAEIATLPDQLDAPHRIAATRLVLGFFRDQLGPPVRPAVMPAARDDDDDDDKARDKDRDKGKDRGRH